MRQLILREHRKTEGVPLTPEELCGIPDAARITITPNRGGPGLFDLTPNSIVGCFQSEGLTVLIRPKIPTPNLLFLISHAMSPDAWRALPFELDESEDLLEAIVPVFLHHVRSALARGLLQGYREIEDTSTVLRGRLRVEEQLRRHLGRFPPVASRYDEFTEDIPLNQVLRAALERLMRLKLRRRALTRELNRTRARFAEVSPLPRAPLPTFAYDRLNAHYQRAAELALRILRATGFDHRHGSIHARSLLIDMNVVFEEFLRTALREALGASPSAFGTATGRHRLFLDEARRIPLYPDLSWWESGRCTFVGDAKYKWLKDAGASSADLYQLHTYCTAADLPGALLVHAEGSHLATTHQVVHSGKTLAIASLDLTRPPTDILAQIDRLAGIVKHQRNGAHQGPQLHSAEP